MGIPLRLSGSPGLFASFAQTVISGRRGRPFSSISQGREAVCLTSPLSCPAGPWEGRLLRLPPCQSAGRSSPAARQPSLGVRRGGEVAYAAFAGSRTKGVTFQPPAGPPILDLRPFSRRRRCRQLSAWTWGWLVVDVRSWLPPLLISPLVSGFVS